MGCGASTTSKPKGAAKYAPDAPTRASDDILPIAEQGHHWAEGAGPDGRARRDAQQPWQEGQEKPPSPLKQPTSPAKQTVDEGKEDAMCVPCDDSFDFAQTFPMYVMKMSTFFEMDVMLSYEDMVKDGRVFKWDESMGDRVFFLSHQWTSFSHPDPLGEQLKVAQQVLTTIQKGELRSLFATEEEYQAYYEKEANRFMNFPKVEPAMMAEEVKEGFVWLDYSSVPQSREAEPERLCAIDSIPSYVDSALAFIALVPRVEHKNLPGVYCDYKSWMSRGWCRLETQVHELRLFKTLEGELMPGLPRLDIPRRPLVVHSGSYATTYDVFDNFYMLWQRKCSVFTGEFACCRLGHKRTDADGKEWTWPCDKDRIRPLVKGMWERKIAHMRTMAPVVRFLFSWRWISHYKLMMAGESDDLGETDHTEMKGYAEMVEKYVLDDSFAATYGGFSEMIRGAFSMHPGFAKEDPKGPELWAQCEAWMDKWKALMPVKKDLLSAFVMGYAVAEGNEPLVRKLHEVDGVSLDLGFMWGITLLDFAAGKGHVRLLRYLLSTGGGKALINKPSFRERITAVDRACKAGFVDALDILVEHGADVNCRRFNQQVPAHGAAIWGHIDVLKRLHDHGADVLGAVDSESKAPLDFAAYFCQAEAEAYLRSLGGEGYKTLYEQQNAAAVQIQKRARGSIGRRPPTGALFTTPDNGEVAAGYR